VRLASVQGNMVSGAALGWLIASVFYFYQYVLRSAPSVMVPQLTEAFGVTATRLASLLGLFYFGYAPLSLVAGVAMDQFGPRKVTPVAAAVVAIGTGLFATGDPALASVGSFLQGGAAAFAFVSAVYIATTRFPPSRAATLLGVTQTLGMAGSFTGVFLVGPAVAGGLRWNHFWLLMVLAGLGLAVLLAIFVPKDPVTRASPQVDAASGRIRGTAIALRSVIGNPQSLICGGIAGLLFLPTTVFAMVWGVQFLQEGHDLPFTVAVMRSAAFPVGWMIGAPLLGFVSDRLGRRKPVILAGGLVLLSCLAIILHGPAGIFPPYSIGLLAGIASGAAMIPYTVIKEVNPSECSGTAAGVIAFINFSLAALLGPIFGNLLARASEGGERELLHYQAAFDPLLYGIIIAMVLTVFLRETGPAAHTESSTRKEGKNGIDRMKSPFAGGQ
jgi:MFS family permease